MEAEIIVAVLLLGALVFLATVDTAFSHISDVGLRRISSEDETGDKKSGKFLREVLDNRQRLRFALSSAIQVLLVCFTVLLTVILDEYVENRARLLLFALSIGLTVTILLRQILPRLIVINNTERKLLFLLPAIRPIYKVVSFLVEPIAARSKAKQKLDTTVTPDAGEERGDDNTEDFQALMEVGEAEGIIEEKERELIETMVEFSDTRAGEIMTPRTEICAVPAGCTVKDARDLIVVEKYSRLPVYRESIDNIEGMIYVRDLLQAWADGRENEPVDSFLREAFFVPETKTAAELLKSMQGTHVQVAIVIDEYGGVAGLVTVEDILEEIVGEIEDEDTEDEEIIEIREGEDGYWDVIGSTDIDKVERIFDIELEDDDYTTIAGLVTTEAGYVPKTGEMLELRGLSVEILTADEKRVHQVRLRKLKNDDEGSVEVEDDQ